MRQMTRAISLIPLIAILGSCEIYEQAEMKHRVKARVTGVLEGSRTGGGKPKVTQQTAICRWYADKAFISDYQELDKASDSYDRWRRQGGIYRELTSFEITTVEILEESQPKTALVSGTINGKPFQMKVPDGQPISWVKKRRR